jgi:amidase
MVKFADYLHYDALGLGELVRQRQVSAQDLVETVLGAIEALNPRLNCIVRTLPDALASSRDANQGPFAGVPFLLKDTGVSLAGVPTEYGSRFFKGFTRPYDNEIVRRYKQAGFLIIGKTNCSELGTSCSAVNVANGSLHNPWHLERIPGISSGGSAAAVASGIVPAAHATDAGGSIRGPASWCGLVGLKPSRGRISYAPDAGEHWSGLGTQHVVTRSVRDCAAILDCTAGPAPGDPYRAPEPARPFLAEVTTEPDVLRIAFATEGPGGMKFSAETQACVTRSAKLLEQLGHRVEMATAQWEPALMGQAIGCIAACMVAEAVAQREADGSVPASPATLELANWIALERGRSFHALDLLRALKQLNTVSRSFASFFEDYDVWLTPTMSDVAPPLDYLDSTSPDVDLLIKRFGELYACNSIYNGSGLPAITLPLYMSSAGLPIGMMFGSSFGNEALLFRLAGQLERALPWRARHPVHSLWTEQAIQ